MPPWIQTYAGRAFDLLFTDPDDILIEDVAQALSMMCRYNGHTDRFYSVAEHSVLVSNLVPEPYAMQGLLHDAHEAYIGDCSSPVKQVMRELAQSEGRRSDWELLEDCVEGHVRDKFGIARELHESVKQADLVALATEKLVLMGESPRPWGGMPPPSDPDLIKCWSPSMAKAHFLRRFEELL